MMVDPQGAAPVAPLCRVRLDVAYFGPSFHGFAENADVVTVAETLRTAMETVLRHSVVLTGAGRTDAGVHAWGQVVSGDITAEADLLRLQRSINRQCSPALVVRSISWAEPDFDARFSAKWRRYRYTVLNTDVPNPFRAPTVWHVPQPLNVDAMQLACDAFLGEHDFSAFCKRPKVEPPVSLVRRILKAEWAGEQGGELVFEICATAFCHNMVRSIVGTMVEVGLGKKSAGDMLAIIRSKDRAFAGKVAPPHGLCLWEVGY
jgi:tRNA pseudouridine38-40 synthase